MQRRQSRFLFQGLDDMIVEVVIDIDDARNDSVRIEFKLCVTD